MTDGQLAAISLTSSCVDLVDVKTRIVLMAAVDKPLIDTVIKFVYLMADLGDGSAIVENDTLKGGSFKVVQIVVGCLHSKARASRMSFETLLSELCQIVN